MDRYQYDTEYHTNLALIEEGMAINMHMMNSPTLNSASGHRQSPPPLGGRSAGGSPLLGTPRGFRPTSSMPQVDDFMDLCQKFGVSPDAKAKLDQAGITSAAILAMLQPGDLETLHLPLGQLRLLQTVQLVVQEGTQGRTLAPPSIQPPNQPTVSTPS